MLKKTLIPALVIAGAMTTTLAACTSAPDMKPTASSAATAAPKIVDGSKGVPSDVPVLTGEAVTSSNHYGDVAKGAFTLNLKTTSENAKDDAVTKLTDGGFTKDKKGGTYSNGKWTVRVVGLGGNVTYTITEK